MQDLIRNNFKTDRMKTMIKPALTPKGVKQKTGELFALTDSALLAQAALAAVDVVTWMVDNFELTVAQYDYLIGLSNPFLTSFNEQVSRAIANKWDITYIPGPGIQDISSANKAEKWIRCKEVSTSGSKANTDFYGGMLTIETGID